MKIDFNDEQLELLKEIISEYAEMCYQEMFDYKRIAVEADEQFVKDEYNAMADSEEEHFNKVKKLTEYIERYEALMRDA